MKKIANCIHHTHWDLIWYFTVQDASVQFSYNMKEILKAFEDGELKQFYLDGQTAPIDEYLNLFPEDTHLIQKYVSNEQLIIGPFNSQLDCFITSGESVINNLRLGIKTSKKLGNVSKVAYLPDSFGHSVDFPKIFNLFGIKDFVITRGVGDEYQLDSEFYLQSDDGSTLLVYTMIAGYGYGCYAFKEGTLFTENAVDYNKIDVHHLISRLLEYSSLDNEFVFPLGFDQNPMIHDVSEQIETYNGLQNEIEFIETTWKEYFEKIRKSNKQLKTHQHELISTQYHRVHRSIYSARADIKALQDQCERILTYELQPMMVLLDYLGIEYSHGLLDKTWEMLILCQTHSSANLTEETNNYIERQTKNALNLALSHKYYLLKLLSISLDNEGAEGQPLIVFSTNPKKHNELIKACVYTNNEKFNLYHNNQKIPYTILNVHKENNGVLRKDFSKIDTEKFYYKTEILFYAENLMGISYRTYDIREESVTKCDYLVSSKHFIENEYYKISKTGNGLSILDKQTGEIHEKAIYIEDSGDEGDSFDYSYPLKDWFIQNYMDSAIAEYKSSELLDQLTLIGSFSIPKNLDERKHKQASSILKYKIVIKLEKSNPLIKLSGYFDNQAEQHRVRLIFDGEYENEYSYAGTQYSIIKRKTNSEEQKDWKEKGYFEEPSPIYPLLNHVSAVSNQQRVMTVYTRSSKEYEFVGEGYKDIGVTVFRSYGALGYPDLNRRPGRPSGLDYMIFNTPDCQMKRKNTFEIALEYSSKYSSNQIFNQYVSYATNCSVYQKQDFDKSVNPIDYFPTNPLENALPRNYKFLSLDETEAIYGTIVKCDTSQDYLLRIYNSEKEKIDGGKLKGKLECNRSFSCDLEENNLKELVHNLGQLNQGELKIIKIETEK